MTPVPLLSIVFMGISLVASFAVPAVIAVFLYKKYRCDIPPFFIGCAVMLIFAFILEQIAHGVIRGLFPGLTDHRVLFALYAGLMAGLFEETGRFTAFKTVMKRFAGNDRNALMYGAGHGGFEAVVILGITMVNNLIFSVMINTGSASLIPTDALNAEQLASLEASLSALSQSQSYVFLLGIAERIAAIVIHMSFSVIVWNGVKYRKPAYVFLAVALHALVDAGTVLLSGSGMHTVLLEAVILLAAAVIALIAVRLTGHQRR